MALQSERSLDQTDWKILRELQKDARLSYNELGRRVGLSAPATAERVRKLEDAGIITSYGAQVEVTKLGLPLLVFIQLRCFPDHCLFKTSSAEKFPEILEMYKLSGNYCALLKVALSSMEHLEAFTERLSFYGEQTTNVVTSNLFSQQVIDWEKPEVNLRPSTQQGWDKRKR
ncbi:Lrp/AsnC family transcriptional regulator [Ktedonosporobacter rubrisoli]|uniref:Lrp/AsnC family transcriptional regulator n=1 Tax=Ktedonosporobacter rubrisoli TaxID=2509675 RepID=A0A4P6JJM1_KTERU|nr:Lrp/AsnC family transcriptional regulator [Ktedonosporobacter rubrisoli]QBD75132.1 Lrp/AsnC family transcriptional regulator [Ktedonosporobacter rubrisoli]